MFSIIVAVAENHAIGCQNKLLWHISEDLKRFKEITTGHTIIMGRKTFESLPKVLPNRQHIVITKNTDFKIDDSSVKVIHSIDEILSLAKEPQEYFIIGGEEIYKQFLPFANKIYLTSVHKDFQADAFFPKINESEWTIMEKTDSNETSPLPFSFITMERAIK